MRRSCRDHQLRWDIRLTGQLTILFFIESGKKKKGSKTVKCFTDRGLFIKEIQIDFSPSFSKICRKDIKHPKLFIQLCNILFCDEDNFLSLLGCCYLVQAQSQRLAVQT